eukprot:4483976-Pleurochrysis_carterae.AAC.1
MVFATSSLRVTSCMWRLILMLAPCCCPCCLRLGNTAVRQDVRPKSEVGSIQYFICCQSNFNARYFVQRHRIRPCEQSACITAETLRRGCSMPADLAVASLSEVRLSVLHVPCRCVSVPMECFEFEFPSLQAQQAFNPHGAFTNTLSTTVEPSEVLLLVLLRTLLGTVEVFDANAFSECGFGRPYEASLAPIARSNQNTSDFRRLAERPYVSVIS